MNLIEVPSHGRDNAVMKVVFAVLLDLKYKQRTKLNSYKPSMFGSSTATLWILLSKAYGLTMTTSTVCVYKPDFQLLQKVLKAHSTH